MSNTEKPLVGLCIKTSKSDVSGMKFIEQNLNKLHLKAFVSTTKQILCVWFLNISERLNDELYFLELE